MSETNSHSDPLPTAGQIRLAIERYLHVAYAGQTPESILELLPPAEFIPAEWLMSDSVERDPSDAPLPAVRSFAVRMGNSKYPNMKLRMSLPPRDRVYLFSVSIRTTVFSTPRQAHRTMRLWRPSRPTTVPLPRR